MSVRFKPALSFDLFTPFYDVFSMVLGFGEELDRKVLKLANIKKNERILDVGMGTGTLIVKALKKNPGLDITGLDPDAKALGIAKNKLKKAGKKAKIVKAYAQEMPFSNNHFDAVLSTLVFHHLTTEIKQQAIKEIYRVLKSGGRFLLADFGKPNTFIEAVLLNLGSIFEGRENMKANLEGKIPPLLEEAGFEVSEVGERYRGVQFLLATKGYQGHGRTHAPRNFLPRPHQRPNNL